MQAPPRRRHMTRWLLHGRKSGRPLCLILSILLLTAAKAELSAQCSLQEGVGQVQSLGCLTNEGAAAILGFAENPNTAPQRGLKAAEDAYLCLLRKGLEPSTYACFRQALSNHVYRSVTRNDLCMDDRLILALLMLRDLADSAARNPLDINAMDAALNEFLAAFSAVRTVRADPNLEASKRIAAAWCLDVDAPAPAYELTQEFINTTVRIASIHPDHGKHLGAVVGAVLRDARALAGDEASRRKLDSAYATLIDPDGEDLAGTSHYYLFEKELLALIPAPHLAEPAQVRKLLDGSDNLLKRLQMGAGRLQSRRLAWKPYERFSDTLAELADQFTEQQIGARDWDRLGRLPCEALRLGLMASAGVEPDTLLRLQQKLYSRVKSHG